MRAWYFDGDTTSDRRLPHRGEPEQFVDIQEVSAKTGLVYFQLDADRYKEDGVLDKIKTERGYNYEDSIHCHEGMENYQATVDNFYTEHLHNDEEIRFITDGSGYFDVRDNQDRWLRLEVTKGDMMILPAGIFHRFTLDEKNYVKANRYFTGTPVWTAFYRHDNKTNNMDVRKKYQASFGQ